MNEATDPLNKETVGEPAPETENSGAAPAESVPEQDETAESADNRASKPDKTDKADRKRSRKAEAELAEMTRKCEAVTAELQEEKEKYLRMLAEYDNFRRRTAKEKEGIYGDACCDTVKELLPVVDTLERAVDGLSEEDAASPLGKGIVMTLKSATDALAKLGVREVETTVFNPDLHNAVMHVDDESLGEGVITDVFQKGYSRGDQIIRYAMVKVAN